MKKAVVGIVVMGALANALAADVVVRDGSNEWRFAEVNGTSRLPLEFMSTGENVTNLQAATLPRYWIARDLVTADAFAAVMGRAAQGAQKGGRPVREIEWDEALQFCDRFTERYRAQLPENCIASMPAMTEWAHAVRVLEGKVDLCGEIGTFLFTGSMYGGYLHTLWRDTEPMKDPLKANEQLAWNLAVVPKRVKLDRVGLRMVLVDITQEMLGDHPIVSRAEVALSHGHFAEARRYLELAKTRGRLASNQLERAEGALAYVREPHEEDAEDWSGLVALAARFAAKDYVVEPFCSRWQLAGWDDGFDRGTAMAYASHNIIGEMEKIGRLPKAVQRDQPLGEPHSVFAEEGAGSVSFTVDTNTLVQVLRCDFTGDGKLDMVVEQFDAVGSLGYSYGFYRQVSEGVYTNVCDLQTVGLCALPRKDGRGCGFITVEKRSNPVLATRLLAYENGTIMGYATGDKPFYMLDAREDLIYKPAPFIGAGLGLGWRIIEGRGVWYRPVFWPWKQRRADAKRSAKP